MFIKVKDHPDLVRDENNKAILNVDNRALNKYKEERAKILKMKQIEKENLSLKNDVEELKLMVKTLMERK